MLPPPGAALFTKARKEAFRRVLNAIDRGDTRELENALDSGMHVDGCPTRGFQPLMLAACQGKMPVAELLIAKGADVNLPFCVDALEPEQKKTKPHAEGQQPLHGAAGYCHVDIVVLLIRAGADVNATDINGCTPLHILFLNGGYKSPQNQCDITEALLSAGANARLADEHGSIPLHYAAARGNIAAIDLLLSSAPETLNQRTWQGWTALGYAASDGHAMGNGHAMASAHLLALGAAVQGSAPSCLLCQAIMETSEGIVRAIIDNTSCLPFALEAPSIAVFIGHARILQHVLKKDGEDMKAFWARTTYADTGTPLLHFAVGHSILPSVRVLLAAGADEAQTDADGRRPRDVVGTMDSETFVREHIRIEGVSNERSARALQGRFRDRGSKACAAIHRLLEQGPAFRCHPWRWPAGRTAARRAANRGRAPSPSSSRAKTTPPMPVVRIFRPKQTAFFAATIGRNASRQELLRELNPILAPVSSC